MVHPDANLYSKEAEPVERWYVMVNQSVAEDLFNRALAINQDAFNAGLFNVAYHALMSALHCAELLESDQPLQKVSKLAIEQLAWIDQHYPEYEHSTQSALKLHMGDGIFLNLSHQAQTLLMMRQTKHLTEPGKEAE